MAAYNLQGAYFWYNTGQVRILPLLVSAQRNASPHSTRCSCVPARVHSTAVFRLAPSCLAAKKVVADWLAAAPPVPADLQLQHQWRKQRQRPAWIYRAPAAARGDCTLALDCIPLAAVPRPGPAAGRSTRHGASAGGQLRSLASRKCLAGCSKFTSSVAPVAAACSCKYWNLQVAFQRVEPRFVTSGGLRVIPFLKDMAAICTYR